MAIVMQLEPGTPGSRQEVVTFTDPTATLPDFELTNDYGVGAGVGPTCLTLPDTSITALRMDQFGTFGTQPDGSDEYPMWTPGGTGSMRLILGVPDTFPTGIPTFITEG